MLGIASVSAHIYIYRPNDLVLPATIRHTIGPVPAPTAIIPLLLFQLHYKNETLNLDGCGGQQRDFPENLKGFPRFYIDGLRTAYHCVISGGLVSRTPTDKQS